MHLLGIILSLSLHDQVYCLDGVHVACSCWSRHALRYVEQAISWMMMMTLNCDFSIAKRWKCRFSAGCILSPCIPVRWKSTHDLVDLWKYGRIYEKECYSGSVRLYLVLLWEPLIERVSQV